MSCSVLWTVWSFCQPNVVNLLGQKLEFGAASCEVARGSLYAFGVDRRLCNNHGRVIDLAHSAGVYMNRVLLSALLVLGFVCLPGTISAPSAVAKTTKRPLTITDRQVVLRKKVAAGQKANELTAKEATKLNDGLDEVSADIEKMKTKNAGKLSYKDEGKIEKRLNGISLKLDKLQLQKRVTAH